MDPPALFKNGLDSSSFKFFYVHFKISLSVYTSFRCSFGGDYIKAINHLGKSHMFMIKSSDL